MLESLQTHFRNISASPWLYVTVIAELLSLRGRPSSIPGTVFSDAPNEFTSHLFGKSTYPPYLQTGEKIQTTLSSESIQQIHTQKFMHTSLNFGLWPIFIFFFVDMGPYGSEYFK